MSFGYFAHYLRAIKKFFFSNGWLHCGGTHAEAEGLTQLRWARKNKACDESGGECHCGAVGRPAAGRVSAGWGSSWSRVACFVCLFSAWLCAQAQEPEGPNGAAVELTFLSLTTGWVARFSHFLTFFVFLISFLLNHFTISKFPLLVFLLSCLPFMNFSLPSFFFFYIALICL